MSVILSELQNRIQEQRREEAIIENGKSYTYGDLENKRVTWLEILKSKRVVAGQVIGLQSDYSTESISLLLALWSNRNIVALVPSGRSDEESFLSDARVEKLFRVNSAGAWSWEERGSVEEHPLLASMKKRERPGFVIFSSGSSGKPKAILHDAARFLEKFRNAKKRFRTLAFLLFDHIAGLDTLFYTLCSGGALVIPEQRSPGYICGMIERCRIEVLPASPTFLNLLCLSKTYENHDLSSLEVITYGSEPMSEFTLSRLQGVFPNVRLVQKYGSSEFGSPSSKSKGNDNLWLKINNQSFETKVIENILWVRSEATMMGYLNEPNPIDKNGWICTGDEVEVDGDWIKVLGRQSEIINVGGEKVYPSEVEAVIMEMDGVLEVVVAGEPNLLMGKMVHAKVRSRQHEDEKAFLKEVRKYCRNRLASYKIPVKIELVRESLINARFKKVNPKSHEVI